MIHGLTVFDLFLGISILSVIVALALTWMHTQGSRCRVRQFALVGFFGAIAGDWRKYLAERVSSMERILADYRRLRAPAAG